jgi:hypothetical protein
MKSQNSRNQGFSHYFCLMMEGSRSGSVLVANRSGFGTPKNIGTDLTDQNADSNPQYCYLEQVSSLLPTSKQCFGSTLVSIRVRTRHFREDPRGSGS